MSGSCTYMPTSDGGVVQIGTAQAVVLTLEQAMEHASCLGIMAEEASPSMVALGWDRHWQQSAKACVEAAKEAAAIRRSKEAAMAGVAA